MPAPQGTKTGNILILGYGNPSRRDDRVGWYILEQLESLVPPNVHLETLHQLDIEWSEQFGDYSMVLFVDCHVSDHDDWTRITELDPTFEVGAVSHHLTPGDLLGISKVLYHNTPIGYLYSVKGTDFNFGTDLSPQTKIAADKTIRDIITKIQSFNDSSIIKD